LKDNSKVRTAFYYKNYFFDFYNLQRPRVKIKIFWTIDVIEKVNKISTKYLKHITETNGLFEIRVKTGTDIFRIFCFFDGFQKLIILNGFQKKSEKTPRSEIKKALLLKLNYEKEQYID
jgi:phage-related protein